MKILQIELQANDLLVAKAFYESVLELPVLTTNDTHLQIQAGDTLIDFRPTGIKPSVYHIAFEIPHNKFEEAFEWMTSRVEILTIGDQSKVADFKNWKAKSFYFLDPLGNILEFIVRFKAPTESKLHFDSASILYVSEIGIVTQNVQEMIHRVQLDFNVPIFTRQPPMQAFAAMGDDRGLFILVAEHREWYPTKIPSIRCYTRVVFEQDGNQFEWTIR